MITTLNEIIDRLHAEETNCYESNDTMILVSDHFALSDEYSRYNDFPFIGEIEERVSTLIGKSHEYEKLNLEMAVLQIKDEEIAKTAPVYMVTPEKQSVRQAIKHLKRDMLSMTALFREQAVEEIMKKKMMPRFITYKNFFALNTFQNISVYLPQLKKINCPWLFDKPLFTRNIGDIQSASTLAVCGGPCLFGAGEMDVVIQTKNGTETHLDYHKHFYYPADTAAAASVFAAFPAETIHFIPQKRGITPQDFEIFDGLFQSAVLLDAPLLVMFPDDPYIKFFDKMTEGLDQNAREMLHNKYKKAVYDICDVYLNFVDKFYNHYKPKQFAVFHRRNKELLTLYYQKREPYYRKTKHITTNTYKEDSILDYISMPAIPYYLWNCGAILNLDSIEEADPMRKCMHNHKSVVTNFPVMMTEKISRDGKTSYFENTLEWKDYISLNDLQFPAFPSKSR